MDVFTRELGTQQGRIQPSGWLPPHGSWVVCFGADREGMVGRLEMGDYVQLAQTADFGDTKTVRVRAKLRAPAFPIGFGPIWDLKLLIDGTVRAWRRLRTDGAGRVVVREVLEFEVSVADLAPGDHTLALRLVASSV